MIEIDNIYNMDCLEGMKQIPEGSVDAVITSPPYYNTMEYSHWESYQDYLSFMAKAMASMYRVLNVGRVCIVNVSCVIQQRKKRLDYSKRYAVPYHVVNIAESVGFEFMDDIIWVKPEGAARNRGQKFYQFRRPLVYRANSVTEYILVFRKSGITPERVYKSVPNDIKEASRVDGDYFRSNVWKINPDSRMVNMHPAAFPVRLPVELVKYYTFIGWKVLDPFIGSGTTAVACIREKRHFIGFELNREYFDKAQKRIRDELDKFL